MLECHILNVESTGLLDLAPSCTAEAQNIQFSPQHLMVSLGETTLRWTNIVWLRKLSYYVSSTQYAQKKSGSDWCDLLPHLQEWQWQLQEPLMATGTCFLQKLLDRYCCSVTPHQGMILPAVSRTSGQVWLEITLIEFPPAFSGNISKKAPSFPYFSLWQQNWSRSSPSEKAWPVTKTRGRRL